MKYINSQNLQFDLLTDMMTLQVTLLPGCPWNIISLITDLNLHIKTYQLAHKPLGISIKKENDSQLTIQGFLANSINALYSRNLINKECKMKMIQFSMSNVAQQFAEGTSAADLLLLKSELHQSIESGIHMGTHHESFI